MEQSLPAELEYDVRLVPYPARLPTVPCFWRDDTLTTHSTTPNHLMGKCPLLRLRMGGTTLTGFRDVIALVCSN